MEDQVNQIWKPGKKKCFLPQGQIWVYFLVDRGISRVLLTRGLLTCSSNRYLVGPLPSLSPHLKPCKWCSQKVFCTPQKFTDNNKNPAQPFTVDSKSSYLAAARRYFLLFSDEGDQLVGKWLLSCSVRKKSTNLSVLNNSKLGECLKKNWAAFS